MNKNRFFFFMLITFSALNNNLFAQYGTQFENSGFERWTNRVSEPEHWHSSGTATGNYANMLSSQIEASAQKRPGSSGIKSVRLYPISVIGVTANGNLTNGRMNAGSMSVTGSSNYNYTQRGNSSFNTPISSMPDSISVWVCFRSASATQNANIHVAVHGDADYKFIANGTEEPINMLVGSARCNFKRTAPANGNYNWTRLSIPFVKDGTCNSPKYILYTITTNETPGQGSTSDDLYVDDILLIYNPTLQLTNLNTTQFHNGDNINISFSLNGTMSSDNLNAEPNQVIAQLSDVNGNFDNPTELGRVTTNTSGTIHAVIPDVDSSYHYQVRVISTNYPMIGENTQEIRILHSNSISEQSVTCDIYPNPFSSTLQIISDQTPKEVIVYDLNGRQMLKSQSSLLDLNELHQGAYLLQVDFGFYKNVYRIIKL